MTSSRRPRGRFPCRCSELLESRSFMGGWSHNKFRVASGIRDAFAFSSRSFPPSIGNSYKVEPGCLQCLHAMSARHCAKSRTHHETM